MGRFLRALDGDRLAISLEITPPRAPTREVLLRRAGLLGLRAQAVNVIQRPDRVSSLEASQELLEAGLEPVCHLTNRGRGGADVRRELEAAAASGVRLALCLRGDHRAEDLPDTPKLRELVGWAVDAGLAVGVTVNHHARREPVLRNLDAKLRAGASFVMSQPVFDVPQFTSLASWVRREHPEVWLVPMVMPLAGASGADGIRKRLGFAVPDAVVARLEREGPAAAFAILTETLRALREAGHADGAVVMTHRMDPPEPFVQELRAAVDRV